MLWQDWFMLSSGMLLVATPGMHDVTFDRTVIFLLEHDESSSMGLVLNRPSDMLVSDAIPQLGAERLAERLYVGGPVEQGTALVLAEPVDPASPDMYFMHEGIGLVDLGTEGVETGLLERARAFSGYAGWGPRQLETETRNGAWILAPCEESDLWDSDHQHLWARVIARQGNMTEFLSAYPEQPWLN